MDYELNLMMMDNFEIESSDYDSLQSDADQESKTTGTKLRRGLTRERTVIGKSSRSLINTTPPIVLLLVARHAAQFASTKTSK